MTSKPQNMSNTAEDNDCPEMDYFLNEGLSDAVFVVEGQPLPVLKSILCVKNKVFRAMFSAKSELNDNEVVIKDTTFEALKTLIRFLYSDQLVLNSETDIQEVCKLCLRFKATKLLNKINEHLMSVPLSLNNIEVITNIAFDYKMSELIAKVMAFVGDNFDHFVHKYINDLNDSTQSRLMKVMAINYRKVNTELTQVKKKMDRFLKGQCKSCGAVTKIDPNFDGKTIPCVYCKRQLSLE